MGVNWIFLMTMVAVATAQDLTSNEGSQCGSTTCSGDMACRAVTDETTGIVEKKCLSAKGSTNPCALGFPLLLNTSQTGLGQVFCGRGPSRMDCPEGFQCNIAPDDTYAVCCENRDKAGTCPAPVTDGSVVGVCAFMCNNDIDCPGEEKCCKNECGGTVCRQPVETTISCATVKCSSGTTCVMQESVCSSPNCPERPVCVPIENKAGTCPAPVTDGSVVGVCAFMCNNDIDCPGEEKCCKNECGGTVCRQPVETTISCATVKCSSGTICVMQESVCSSTNCPERPVCVPVEKIGACPKTTFLQSLQLCLQKGCSGDTDCPGDQKCCKHISWCKRGCLQPVPAITCANTLCKVGHFCKMQPVQCVTTPCFDVPACLEIATACNPKCKDGYICELRSKGFFRIKQEPTCVVDVDNPVCEPGCSKGYTCQLRKPWYCYFCRATPTCVRSEE